MRNRIKVMLIVGPVIVSFINGLTEPIIMIYFYKLISPTIIAFSNVLGLGLAALVNSSITVDSMKKFYRKHFAEIVIIDVISFGIVSLMGVEHAEIRFVGMSIISAVSTSLWCIVINDSVNNAIHGNTLTKWQSFTRSWYLYAALSGAILAMLFTEMDVTVCVGAQCLANAIMGFLDMRAYRLLGEHE